MSNAGFAELTTHLVGVAMTFQVQHKIQISHVQHPGSFDTIVCYAPLKNATPLASPAQSASGCQDSDMSSFWHHAFEQSTFALTCAESTAASQAVFCRRLNPSPVRPNLSFMCSLVKPCHAVFGILKRAAVTSQQRTEQQPINSDCCNRHS